MLLPDRLKEVWASVEQQRRTATDATREQERLIDEHRAVWEKALRLEPHQGLEHSTLEELASCFTGIDQGELENRCREATRRLKADAGTGAEEATRSSSFMISTRATSSI
jgi:hypothetical protein